MTKEQILQFMSAGNAIFTLKSLKTSEHFTYKIRFAPQGLVKFAYLGVGYDEWMYLGVFTDAPHGLRLTAKSHFTDTAPSVRALRWFLNHVGDPRVEFKHAGRCGRCGRVLTHPDSIDSGMGPECSGRGGRHAKRWHEGRTTEARMSSSEPNLQNLVKPTELGTQIKVAFAHAETGRSYSDRPNIRTIDGSIQGGRPEVRLSNFQRQAQGADDMLERMIELSLRALPQGARQMRIHDEIMVELPEGFNPDARSVHPVEQTDCSAAIDNAIESWKK